jgi:Lyase
LSSPRARLLLQVAIIDIADHDRTPSDGVAEPGRELERLATTERRVDRLQIQLYPLAQGSGTAVGTGLNAKPQFAKLIAKKIAELTRLPFVDEAVMVDEPPALLPELWNRNLSWGARWDVQLGPMHLSHREAVVSS